MIKFVYIGDQINEDNKDFCFFDTGRVEFLSFDGQQIFKSINEFRNCFSGDDKDRMIDYLQLIDRNKVYEKN